MRVLFVCNFEAPYRIDFWNELSKYCDLTVIFTETKEQQMKSQKRDATWFDNEKYKFNSSLLKQTKVGRLRICFGVKEFLNKKYDVIVFHPYSPPSCILGILYCITHKIPYVINSDGGFAKSGKGINERFKKYLLSHAEALLSTGMETDKYLKFYGVKENRIYRYTLTSLFERNIRKKVYSREEIKRYREELGINEEKVLLTVGRVIPLKGYDTLIRAAARLEQNIGIYIVGGEETEELRALRLKLGVTNIQFIDFVKRDEIYKYYAAADAFVMTTRSDVWGLVINEALANGLPVVSTRMCIAATELINENYNGFFFETNNDYQLANIISHYFNEVDRDTMSKNALKSIENITFETMAKTHIEIFRRIITKR